MKRSVFSSITLILAVIISGQSTLWADTIDLSHRMTPVKHQGDRNTCNAFAATALVEFLIKEKTGQDIDLSEAYAYYLGKTKALTTPYTKKAYTNDDGLAGFLAVKAYEYGCIAESDWPYELQNWFQKKDPRCTFTQGKPDPICFIGVPPKQAKQLQHRVSPIFIEPENFANFLLKTQKPIVFNILWFADSVNNQTGALHMPTAQEKSVQAYGHVVLLVGYDSVAKQFIFRNSWGPGWGKNGYGTLPEDYVLNYGEVNKFKPFEQYPADIKEFLETGSLGVSAILDD